MTGFLLKDWSILKRQGRAYGFVLAVAVLLAFVGSKNYSSFISSYLTFMIAMYSFSSFNYDEYENGMAFLMALPCGRRDYVKEKYIFSILLVTGGWTVGILLRTALFLIRFSLAEYLEILPTEPVYLLIAFLYVGCGFPLVIKYGVEKGRMLSFGILAVMLVGIFLLARYYKVITPAITLINRIYKFSPFLLPVCALVACALILGISCRISLKIMEKREF